MEAGQRERGTHWHVSLLTAVWLLLYVGVALFRPPLLDDADSVHAEAAREMLVRHDWTTLYVNGIRYLEKAPLLYWCMAGGFRIFGVHTWAARLPLALATLALLLTVYALGRRMFLSRWTGLCAALVLATSFGLFIFTRILIPDAMLCLWLTVAMLALWRGLEQPDRRSAVTFAVACALGVLTKGLIGLVFPLLIAGVFLLMTRRLRHVAHWHPVLGVVVFFAIAAPWHIAAGIANPTAGNPLGAMPTDGNVHGWFWFYFVNEHLLRYLNQRVPRDYDTVPLLLFWGLLLVWLMPWSAFLVQALARVPLGRWHVRATLSAAEQARLLLLVWAAVPMVFFSFSTRQEYYVLPALPAVALLTGDWLGSDAEPTRSGRGIRTAWGLFAAGACGAAMALAFAVHAPAAHGDLATTLSSHPADYALSFGHFLDLSTQAMGFFRLPLVLTAIALAGGSGAHLLYRRAGRPRAAVVALAGGSAVFLIAAHLALVTFSPVLSSAHLAEALRPRLAPGDVLILNGEYESGSTLPFYLARQVRILNGRSSNLWYGSFFPDAPRIFDDDASMALLWRGESRVFLLTDAAHPPLLPSAAYVIAQEGGKAILSNRP